MSSHISALAKLDNYTKGELVQLSNQTNELNSNYLILRDKYSEIYQN